MNENPRATSWKPPGPLSGAGRVLKRGGVSWALVRQCQLARESSRKASRGPRGLPQVKKRRACTRGHRSRQTPLTCIWAFPKMEGAQGQGMEPSLECLCGCPLLVQLRKHFLKKEVLEGPVFYPYRFLELRVQIRLLALWTWSSLRAGGSLEWVRVLSILKNSPSISVSWGHCNRLLQTLRLKSSGINALTVLEATSPASRCPQGHMSSRDSRGGSLLPLPAPGGCWLSLARGCITRLCLCLPRAFSCVSLCVLFRLLQGHSLDLGPP